MIRIMQTLLELAPVLAFCVAYYLHGIYLATSVLMVGMALLLVVDYVRERRIPIMHGLSALLVFVLGAATLISHNQRFIQWKPTVFFWLASAAFLGSFWVGECTLVERFLGKALGAPLSVSRQAWSRLNTLWVAFYALLGGLNLLVAFNASERAWVNFKVFGLTTLTAVFIGIQLVWLSRQLEPEAPLQSDSPGSDTPQSDTPQLDNPSDKPGNPAAPSLVLSQAPSPSQPSVPSSQAQPS